MRADRKKGQLIENFHQNMVSCEVRFDKDKAHFFAEHATQRFEAPSLPQLRAMLKKHAQDYQPVAWEKVILVSVEWRTEENHHNGIGVPRGEARRHRELSLEWHVFERARAHIQEGKEQVWYTRTADPAEYVEERRKGDAFFDVQRHYSGWDDAIIIPFTAEALRSIEAIAQGLQTLNEKLAVLLSQEHASKFLNGQVQLGRLLEAVNERES